MTTNMDKFILSLSLVNGVGSVFLKKNLSGLDGFFSGDSEEDWFSAIKDFLRQRKKVITDDEIHKVILESSAIFEACRASGVNIVSIASRNYPRLLFEVKDAPPILYFIGNYTLINKVISIIGTRNPNENGKIIASRVGNFFSSNSWSVCNGLAEGVDTCAVGNEKEMFSNVVGVLAGGLDFKGNLLIKSTRKMAERVLSNNGLIISEFSPFKKQDVFTTVKSCRVQAGLSSGLILVQSSVSGGSKFAVQTIAELGRILGVIYPIKNDIDLKEYEANHLLLNSGIEGLCRFTSLSEAKVRNCKIFSVKSKDSYLDFEASISETWNRVNNNSPSLYENLTL